MATSFVSRLFYSTPKQISTIRRICYDTSLKLGRNTVMDIDTGVNVSSNIGPQLFGTLGLQQIRCRVKNYFSRPSEHKRIRKHGWKKMMSTAGGRMVVMRRLLKGRHAITH
ncbi:hypothetical protein CHUAL_009230 [Chamberlinius hualienensis]